MNAAILNVLPVTRELDAAIFYFSWILFESCDEREGRKLDPCDTRCFQCSLLVGPEIIDLSFDHLPDVVRHADFDVIDIDAQVPPAGTLNNQARLQEVVDGIHHEQRVPISAAVYQLCESSREPVAGKSDHQVITSGCDVQVFKRHLNNCCLTAFSG